jgi:hypothetical protein
MKNLCFVVLHVVALFGMPHGVLAQTVYPTETTIYVEGLAYEGITFYPGLDQRAKLIDMQGTVIHEWLAPDPLDVLFYPIYEPIPETPGHVLAIESNRVRELDWDSNVVWQFEAPVNLGVGDLDHSVEFHHDAVNGNTLAVEGPKGRIFEFTPTGDLVWEYMTPFFGVIEVPGNVPIQVSGIYRAYRLPLSWLPDQ